jgi:hypothetical protein
MSLIVEDGTGKADAESYISVADATTYHTNMGNRDAWGSIGNEAAKEAVLRQATSFMSNRYFEQWMGYGTNLTQRLDWPRIGVYTRNRNVVANNAIPDQIKAACAELALRAASGELEPDMQQAVKREKIGPIEVEYDQYSPDTPTYLRIDAMLAEFLSAGGASGPNMPLMRV